MKNTNQRHSLSQWTLEPLNRKELTRIAKSKGDAAEIAIVLLGPKRMGPIGCLARPEIRNKLVAMVLEDASIKVIAYTMKISVNSLYKLLPKLGFTRMYVTNEERKAILIQRKK